MSSIPGGWPLLRPHRRQRVHRQGCLEMRQRFYTHSRIKEELAEEEDSHLDRQIIQWRPWVNLTTLWGHRGAHLLRQVLEELVC